MRYAFCFKHKLFSTAEESQTITEYFRPYSPQVLLEVVKSKNLRERLQQAISSEMTFEDFIYIHHMQDSPYIRQFSEYDLQERGIWINDENDLFETSQWDYLADAKLMIDTVKYGRDFIHHLNSLADITMISRLQFNHLRLLISILVYTDFPDFENWQIHLPPLPEIDDETRELLLRIFAVLDNYPYSDPDIVLELCSQYLDYGSPLYKYEHLSILLKQTYDLFSSAILFEPAERKYVLNRIRYLKRQFFGILGKESGKRQSYIRKCFSLVNSHSKFTSSIKLIDISDTEILHMCLDSNIYSDMIPTLIDNLIRYSNFEETISNYDARLHNEDFTALTRIFESNIPKIGSYENIGSYYEKYSSKGRGCFAMLITDDNRKYFSLSGKYELLPDKRAQIESLVRYILENALQSSIPIGHLYDDIYEYNWAYLNNKTMRYTEIVDNRKEQPNKYITTPISLGSDLSALRLTENSPEIGPTFSCCERKILGHINGAGVSEIYSRYAPCWMCRPAVLSVQPCDFYAYVDLDTHPKNTPIGSILKKYTVTCTTTYGLRTP